MNNSIVLVALSALAVVLMVAAVEAQQEQGRRADLAPDAHQPQAGQKKDKRGLGLFGPVIGYGYGYDALAAPAVPVAYAPAGYKTPVAVPYAAGYAVPVAKVAYGPGPAYGAFTDGTYSRLGSLAPFGAYGAQAALGPYGYVAEGYSPAPYAPGVVAAPLAAGYKAYAY